VHFYTNRAQQLIDCISKTAVLCLVLHFLTI